MMKLDLDVHLSLPSFILPPFLYYTNPPKFAYTADKTAHRRLYL
jgi:hypothetical protein